MLSTRVLELNLKTTLFGNRQPFTEKFKGCVIMTKFHPNYFLIILDIMGRGGSDSLIKYFFFSSITKDIPITHIDPCRFQLSDQIIKLYIMRFKA